MNPRIQKLCLSIRGPQNASFVSETENFRFFHDLYKENDCTHDCTISKSGVIVLGPD